jgi:hypothetical protein
MLMLTDKISHSVDPVSKIHFCALNGLTVCIVIPRCALTEGQQPGIGAASKANNKGGLSTRL